MIGCAEVEGGGGCVLNVSISMELGAVVGGNGPKGTLLSSDELNEALVGGLGVRARQLADNRVFRLSFDEGDDAVLVRIADHRIDFPMADARAVLGADRALGDVPLTRHDPA